MLTLPCYVVIRCAMKSNTRFSMSRLARHDITEILQYTEESWGRHQRNVYLRELVRAGRQLTAFPEMGRESESREVRELVLRHHVILYQYRDDTVTILRVLNPRRLRR